MTLPEIKELLGDCGSFYRLWDIDLAKFKVYEAHLKTLAEQLQMQLQKLRADDSEVGGKRFNEALGLATVTMAARCSSANLISRLHYGLTRKIHVLGHGLTDIFQEYNRLMTVRVSREKSLEEAKHEVDELEKELTAETAKNKDLSRDRWAWEGKNKTLGETIASVKNKNEELKKELEAVEARTGELKRKVEEEKKTQASLEDDLERCNKGVEVLEEAIKKKGDRAEKLKEEEEAMDEKYRRGMVDLAERASQYEEKMAALAKVMKNMGTIEKMKNALICVHGATEADLESLKIHFPADDSLEARRANRPVPVPGDSSGEALIMVTTCMSGMVQEALDKVAAERGSRERAVGLVEPTDEEGKKKLNEDRKKADDAAVKQIILVDEYLQRKNKKTQVTAITAEQLDNALRGVVNTVKAVVQQAGVTGDQASSSRVATAAPPSLVKSAPAASGSQAPSYIPLPPVGVGL